MQVRSLLATAFTVATLAAGGNAFAQTAPLGQEGGSVQPVVSTASRADVLADLVLFRAQYPVSPWSTRYNPLGIFKSTQSRAEVTAAYLADRDEVAALTGEDSGSAYLAHAGNRSATSNGNLASNDSAAQVR